MNNIMCCEMTEEARNRLCRNSNDYEGVVVKFFPEVNFIDVDRNEDIAVSATISSHKLSPRLIFVDDKCYVYEYVKV